MFFEEQKATSPPLGRAAPPGGKIVALLGPTNTGKTHFAMERLLAHPSGMIGFPLRLLARENYDRAVSIKGKGAIALITGEEKITPPFAKYYICTVEAMPLELEVDFLAVDEIQMAADPERGHIFTERLLYARGKVETFFMGAETAKSLVHSLVPRVEMLSRPRLSKLSYQGYRKISRLPRRSAVVAFSVNEVYRLAEMTRRQRGGAAVVMGALSPRARNAQVALYQEGEVDYLIATDAIGMGLNMDVNHVAFAGLSKFDGNRPRRLAASEIGQIAGRAGRNMRDGGFGPTGEILEIDQDIIERVEEHRFQNLKRFFWRNPDLDFQTIKQLKQSLELPPPSPLLARGREGDDVAALTVLMRDEEVLAKATSKSAVSLLWDVCQIPDFRKTLTDSHTRLLSEIYLRLLSHQRLDATWIARHIDRLDKPDGDIDLLMARISGIRVWTYISHRVGWLDDAIHWQERSRAIEDRLSDALHDRLTQRFVDRRSASIVRKLADGSELLGGVDAEGCVIVEGKPVGRLKGFQLSLDENEGFIEDRRTLRSAALRIVQSAASDLASRCVAAQDEQFTLDDKARIHWAGGPVAKLKPGKVHTRPEIELFSADALNHQARRDVELRIKAWLDAWCSITLAPLIRLKTENLSPAGRGLAFQLEEQFGWLDRRQAGIQIKALTKSDRQVLKTAGFRIGHLAIWSPPLMLGRAAKTRQLLARLHGKEITRPSKRSFLIKSPKAKSETEALALAGFVILGQHALRIDKAERLASLAFSMAHKGQEIMPSKLAIKIGLDELTLPELLIGLGLRQNTNEKGIQSFTLRTFTKKSKPKQSARYRKDTKPINPDSPFASLREASLG
ncbi:MAG: helicase-related protein [Rhodospirillales bacterium]